jgi:hypothetical protein
MPSSRPDPIPVVIHLLSQLRPRSILDVGVGFGKWGHLFREYTDIKEAETDPRRYQREHWQVRIDGIEGHAAYLTDLHRFLYNEIHLGDALTVLPKLDRYDLVFLGDIIEHFEKAQGRQLLEQALAHANQAVVVTTPKYDTAQENLCQNELERHRSLWAPRDFQKFPNAQVRTIAGDTLLVVLRQSGQRELLLTAPRRPKPRQQREWQEARAALLKLIPLDEPFVLVDEEQVRALLPHRCIHPFIGQQGVYWGPPASDEQAVAELARLQAQGVKRIVFIPATSWWLDHYPGLRQYLEQHWVQMPAAPLMMYQLR